MLDATGGRGVDIAIDMVGGDQINALMKATRVNGRIVNVGRLGGLTAPFDLDLHAARRLIFIGVTFRTRSLEEVAQIVDAMVSDLLSAIRDKTISFPIDSAFPLREALGAHTRMRQNNHFGKIVLIPSPLGV